jgi:hypothetical protein
VRIPVLRFRVLQVEIEHDETRAGGDAYQCIRPAPPPCPNQRSVRGCVVEPMIGEWPLVVLSARLVLAGKTWIPAAARLTAA